MVLPELLQPYVRDGYHRKIIELSAYYDEQEGILHFLTGRYPFAGEGDQAADPDAKNVSMEFVDYSPETGEWSKRDEGGDYGIVGGGGISFAFPAMTRTGRLVVPGCGTIFDGDGKAVHVGTCWAPVNFSFLWIKDPSTPWRPGRPLPNVESSTRGFSEHAVIQLEDGRLATVLRGSNDSLEDLYEGYKWIAFSNDDGETWTTPAPWQYSDGQPIVSSSTGCALFRSEKNGRIYWIGNLCRPGEHAHGNWPRSPLWIGEVDEKTCTLMRNSLRTIDERHSDDGPTTQLSNFKFYQERPSGDVILFVSRLGERDEEKWFDADTWQYRITLG